MRKLRYSASNSTMQPGALLVPGLRGSSGSVSEMITFGMGPMSGAGSPSLVKTPTPKLALCGPDQAEGLGMLPGLTATGTGTTTVPATTSTGTGILPGLTTTGTGSTFSGECFNECVVQFNCIPANVGDGFSCDQCNEGLNLHVFALMEIGGSGGYCNPPELAPDTCAWTFFDSSYFGAPGFTFCPQLGITFRIVGDHSINKWRIELAVVLGQLGADTQTIVYTKTTATPCAMISTVFGPADICVNENNGLFCDLSAATWAVGAA